MMASKPRVAREALRQKEWYPMPWDGTKRTVHTETVDQTYATLERKTTLKRQVSYKRHQEYKVFYYGTPVEKEQYQKMIRNYLQEQIDEREKGNVHFSCNTEESDRLTKASIKHNQFEKEQNDAKRQYLMTIRDSNKTTMDLKAKQNKIDKMTAQSKEVELLQCNPINWSQTLS